MFIERSTSLGATVSVFVHRTLHIPSIGRTKTSLRYHACLEQCAQLALPRGTRQHGTTYICSSSPSHAKELEMTKTRDQGVATEGDFGLRLKPTI